MTTSLEYSSTFRHCWNNHNDHVTKTLASMRKYTTLSDLIFVCQGENNEIKPKRINAHKAILSSASKFLKELFEIAYQKQPYERIVINLDSVDPNIFEKLIEFMYEGKTTVNQEQREKLIRLCKLL